MPASGYQESDDICIEYLHQLAIDKPSLAEPAQQWTRVSELLGGVSQFFSSQQMPSRDDDLRGVVNVLHSVALAEKHAIDGLRSCLEVSVR